MRRLANIRSRMAGVTALPRVNEINASFGNPVPKGRLRYALSQRDLANLSNPGALPPEDPYPADFWRNSVVSRSRRVSFGGLWRGVPTRKGRRSNLQPLSCGAGR